jgi:ribosome maturation factor RimP
LAEPALAGRIDALIAPALDAMGYAVVRVRLSGSKRRTLQVMAERMDGRNMTVDDCTEISRSISAILDVEDPIRGAYTLEVSSPGIDRPLTRPEDFDRFAGHQAKVELAEPIDGRRRFRGRIDGHDGGRVRLALTEGVVSLPFEGIVNAQLILTDDLIAASQQNNGD